MKIEADKIGHFHAGIAVAALFYPFGLIAAIVATFIAAIGKEIWDSYGHGTPDKYDALATILGGGVLLAWYWCINVVHFH